MNAWTKGAEGETDDANSSFSSQSDKRGRRQEVRAPNPYADLKMPDGRRFQIAELRAFDAHERGLWGGASLERRTQGDAPRFEVEIEVQSDGRSDNFLFRVRITWDAVRRGELERVGYQRRCDRPTAIFLLARERVWHYLCGHASPPRFSSHQRPVWLDVE